MIILYQDFLFILIIILKFNQNDEIKNMSLLYFKYYIMHNIDTIDNSKNLIIIFTVLHIIILYLETLKLKNTILNA